MFPLATTLAGLGMRFGPQLIRGIGKALGFSRKVGQALNKTKTVSGQIKQPAQMLVGGLFGANSKESQMFNKYSDKFDSGVNKASEFVDKGVSQGERFHTNLKASGRFKTRPTNPQTQGFV